jgi:transcriptional regulator with XRE-family HTH domain
MEMIGKIRRMFFRDKMSLHEIAKRTSLSRNTIRKWLRNTGEVTQPTYRRSQMPCKLSAFHEALEQALKADSLRHKQSRRTAKDLFLKSNWMVIRAAIAVSPISFVAGENVQARCRARLCR